MKTNTIDLFKICAGCPYGLEFQLKHQEVMKRVVGQYHRRADALKRGA